MRNRTEGTTRLVSLQIYGLPILYGCDFSFSSSRAVLKECLQLRRLHGGLVEGHAVYPSLQIVQIIFQEQGKTSNQNT